MAKTRYCWNHQNGRYQRLWAFSTSRKGKLDCSNFSKLVQIGIRLSKLVKSWWNLAEIVFIGLNLFKLLRPNLYKLSNINLHFFSFPFWKGWTKTDYLKVRNWPHLRLLWLWGMWYWIWKHLWPDYWQGSWFLCQVWIWKLVGDPPS